MHNARRVTILGWALIILVNLLFVLGIGEIALRLVPPNPRTLLDIVERTDDSRPYRLQPNTQTSFLGFSDPMPHPITWQINDHGIRADRAIADKNGRFRILTYGDSETFGWSVQLEDTWQRRMEAIDDRIQVLNLGIPGYNAENVAEHMELTAPALNPDLIMYLFHKNDFYDSLSISPVLSKSELYVHLRMAIYALGADRRHAWRRSPEAYRFVASQIERMLAVAKRIDVPFVIAFRHWKYRGVMEREYWRNDALALASALPRTPKFSAEAVNIEPVVEPFPRRDNHLTEPAQEALAIQLCEFLSGVPDNGCYWSGAGH